MRDHPAVLGAFGALPLCPLYDIEVMQNTFDFVWENWQWEDTWGLLAAVVMMCAGYDGCTIPNPGIPRNGLWAVKWEGLSPMP